jgi:hypothetical protein
MAKWYDIDTDMRLNGKLTASGDIVTTGNISGNMIMGNGSLLTNLPIPVATATPSSGSTNPISAGWAFTHEAKTGSGGHIPTGGSATTFLRGDNTWVTPTDYYVSSVASTDGGNGTLTLNRSGTTALTISLAHNHDSVYYTETEVNGLLANKSDVGHTHAYDNYQYWGLQVNGGTAQSINSNANVNLIAGSNVTMTITGNAITINAVQRPIDDVPVDGVTTESISSNWAFDHQAKTGANGGHIPTAGTTSQYLRGDGVWATPPDNNTNNYLTGVSGAGNGTVTFTRNGLANLTWDSSHTHSQYVLNNTDNQVVNTGFNIKGSALLGINGTAGSLYVKNSSGTNVIHIAGDTTAKGASIKAYVNANGDATFDGTVAVNKLQVTNTALVTNLNAEFVGGISEKNLGRKEIALEVGGWGIHSGFRAKQSGVGLQTQFTVESGIAYTKSGKRVEYAGGDYTTSAPSVTANNHRIDAIYIAGPSEGNNEGEIKHVTGAYSSTPVAPAIPSDGIKIADIYMGSNQGTITDARITDRRTFKDVRFDLASDRLVVDRLDLVDVTTSNSSIVFNKPIKGASFAKSITISAGSTSSTWTHNLGLGTSYVITFSCNSAEPHVYWTNKATNSIVINLDDVCESSVTIDCLITAV